MSSISTVLGIDLGTTTSCCSVVVGGKPYIIADSHGKRVIPTVVAVTPQGETVGHKARERLVTDPENTIYSFKRLLGKRFSDPSVRIAIASSPYHVAQGPEESVIIKARDQEYSIPEIASRIVRHLMELAKTKMGTVPQRAVIAVPASFDAAQRAAVRIAGRIAGLKAIQLINEPTAAALAFGYDHRQDGQVAVFDFGGGTLDVTVLRLENGSIDVLGAAGDSMLGGDDLDMALAFAAAEAFRIETGRNLWRDVAEWQRLLFACESAKRRLSLEPRTEIRLRSVARTPSGVRDFVYRIDRRRFNQICGEKLEQTLRSCHNALVQADLSAHQLDAVVLVGGSSFIRSVRARVARFFGLCPDVTVDPVEAVALGASIHGARWSGCAVDTPQPPKLLDVATKDIALDSGQGGALIFERHEPLPVSEIRCFEAAVDKNMIRVKVLERYPSTNWVQVGMLTLEGIIASHGEIIPVEAQVMLDAGGELAIRLLDRRSGKSVTKHFQIRGTSKITR